MKTFTSFFVKTLFVFIPIILLFNNNLVGQTGSFSRYVSQDGWSGNVEFYVPSGSGVKPLVIGLHPGGQPAWGMRDMLSQSSSDKNFILVCPDGSDASLSESIIPLINYCKNQFNIDETKLFLNAVLSKHNFKIQVLIPNSLKLVELPIPVHIISADNLQPIGIHALILLTVSSPNLIKSL